MSGIRSVWHCHGETILTKCVLSALVGTVADKKRFSRGKSTSRVASKNRVVGERLKGGRRGRRRMAVALSAFMLGAGMAAGAHAEEAGVLGPPHSTITETSVLKYHFRNRNTDRLDDRYGEWLNRFNAQVSSGRFTGALRVDSAVYFHTPNPNTLAEEDLRSVLGRPPLPGEVREPDWGSTSWQRNYLAGRTDYYGRELSDRYITTAYPSKFSLRYKQGGLDVIAGDYYAQLGRGLVLAVRKIDELASDTTLRGGKVVYTPEWGKARFHATIMVGVGNPIRTDEVSGRLLMQSTSSMAEKVAYPAVPQPHQTYYVQQPQPNYASDLVVGGQVEGGLPQLQFGMRAIQLERADRSWSDRGDSPDPSRNSHRVGVGSVSVNAPSISNHGTFYAELAGQSLSGFASANETLINRLSGGYAGYALATVYGGPLTLSVEGKHYERFYPLHANVGGHGAADFSYLRYNIAPTTDPITADWHWGWYDVCVSGARTRLDARLADHVLVYGSLGRYRSYSERSASCGEEARSREAPTGKNEEIRNDIWDPFVGAELTFEQSRSHLFVSSGTHFDDTATPIALSGLGEATTIEYRESWVRYSGLKKIHGPWSVEISGWHRYRYRPAERPTAWREGENYVSALWSPKLTVALGVEYSTQLGDWTNYLNGLVHWRFTPDKSVRLFVGQTRPALRCVSGMCKQYPAFEGVRMDGTVTF